MRLLNMGIPIDTIHEGVALPQTGSIGCLWSGTALTRVFGPETGRESPLVGWFVRVLYAKTVICVGPTPADIFEEWRRRDPRNGWRRRPGACSVPGGGGNPRHSEEDGRKPFQPCVRSQCCIRSDETGYTNLQRDRQVEGIT